jgi:myo-inositol-1-phosphate synthase
MSKRLRIAVAGVGNNISALVQGIYYYRERAGRNGGGPPAGLKRAVIGGYGVGDIDFSVAFDVNREKVGRRLDEAIWSAPNNYPRLDAEVPPLEARVRPGPVLDGVPPHLADSFSMHGEAVSEEAVTRALAETRTDVLLYSLPTGAQNAATFYARCALGAGAALVNCTPDTVARDPALLSAFTDAGIPLLGDDLASHIGSSIVHKALLELFQDRGIDVESSYQLNIGGNMDFKNLTRRGEAKAQSKKNALRGLVSDLSAIDIVPSGGYMPTLGDRKVAFMKVEGVGWGGSKVSLDVTLTVQDSSNAAGVIIDLVRIAGAARDAGVGGFVNGAGYLLKSPPDSTLPRSADRLDMAVEALAPDPLVSA